MVDQKSTGSLGAQVLQEGQEALDIQTLARLEGLDRALLHFPEDVKTAARVAFNVRATLQASEDNTTEIWPVMQVKS